MLARLTRFLITSSERRARAHKLAAVDHQLRRGVDDARANPSRELAGRIMSAVNDASHAPERAASRGGMLRLALAGCAVVLLAAVGIMLIPGSPTDEARRGDGERAARAITEASRRLTVVASSLMAEDPVNDGLVSEAYAVARDTQSIANMMLSRMPFKPADADWSIELVPADEADES
ncbi:MAG: hypothetical protein KAS72_09805 [Phycisphaerales bacterium]|nr:hypothetical protein [Phycisphaerales bacterium]